MLRKAELRVTKGKFQLSFCRFANEKFCYLEEKFFYAYLLYCSILRCFFAYAKTQLHRCLPTNGQMSRILN